MSRATEKLFLYVPTKGRVDLQYSLKILPLSWHKRTIIVCPKDEIKAHQRNWPKMQVLEQGKDVRGIADARAWIFHHAYKVGHTKIAMIDDDIKFAARKRTLKRFAGIGRTTSAEWEAINAKYPGLGQLEVLPPQDDRMNPFLYGMEDMLSRYAHTGMHARLMSNQMVYEWRMNTRIQQVYGYHVPTMIKHCEIGRKIMRDDFDYELQLLTQGFECPVYCWVVGEQALGFAGKGGQDSSRTLKLNDADAIKLAKMYPGLVRVVDRVYNRMSRKEVIIQWHKAALQGKASHLL